MRPSPTAQLGHNERNTMTNDTPEAVVWEARYAGGPVGVRTLTQLDADTWEFDAFQRTVRVRSVGGGVYASVMLLPGTDVARDERCYKRDGDEYVYCAADGTVVPGLAGRPYYPPQYRDTPVMERYGIYFSPAAEAEIIEHGYLRSQR